MVAMFPSLIQFVGSLVLLASPTPIGAIRADTRCDHARANANDFFRALLEVGEYEWITSMSFYTGPPTTSSPSASPRGNHKSPTISPSKRWIPVDSMTPTNSKGGETTFQPTLSKAPYIQFKPVSTSTPPTIEPTSKSKLALPTINPSKVNSRVPTTTKTPQSDIFTEKPMPVQTIVTKSMQPTVLSSGNETPASHQRDVFYCDKNNVISIVDPPVGTTTSIQFRVGYAVESTANISDYIDTVERLLLVTALAGVLQCETGGGFFTNLTTGATGRSKATLGILFNTKSTNDTCEAAVSSCHVFETQFQVAVNETLDPDIAAFLGYVMLKEKMDDGTFPHIIPTIDKCEYLKPLPLFPPDAQGNDTSKGENESTERLSVSPWSLAAVSAMCAGGVIAIALWNKKRVYRNRRHMELVEEASSNSPLDS